MPFSPLRTPAVWFLLSFALGCAPQIGDECQTSADCSQTGDRLCDITQRDGYCTVFNCEPGNCPDDSVCVAFGANLSTVPACADASGFSRFQRSFCLAPCSSNSDCRTGYACLDLRQPDNHWGAVVVDRGPGRVCLEPPRAERVPETRAGEVCSPRFSGGVPTEEEPDTGSER